LGARDPEQARDALEGIRRASKDALTELRITLDLMRGMGGTGPREPARGLTDLDRLVSDAADNGMDVRVEVRGHPHPLPAAVELAAYRIVQESLTNVARHAGSPAATVTLGFVADAFEIEIVDKGRSVSFREEQSGHGIAGMKERAAAVGGRFEAGARPQGGFRVWTKLPAGNAR